jgi:hypothetical protein
MKKFHVLGFIARYLPTLIVLAICSNAAARSYLGISLCEKSTLDKIESEVQASKGVVAKTYPSELGIDALSISVKNVDIGNGSTLDFSLNTLNGVVYEIHITDTSIIKSSSYPIIINNDGSAIYELKSLFDGVYGSQVGTRTVLDGPLAGEIRTYWRIPSDNRVELYQFYRNNDMIKSTGYRYTCKGFEKRKLDAEARAKSIQNKQKASGVKL